MEEFRKSGLLWFINRTLHLFGWALCVELNGAGEAVSCFPARCKFRGFDESCENEGFETLTAYLEKESSNLLKEVVDNQ